MTVFTKAYSFSAIHHLPPESGTHEPSHGHSYRLDVSVTGKLDEVSGLICDRDLLDKKVDEVILSKYNYTDLNQHFENTSAEYLVYKFKQLLVEGAPELNIVDVALQETSKNRFVS